MSIDLQTPFVFGVEQVKLDYRLCISLFFTSCVIKNAIHKRKKHFFFIRYNTSLQRTFIWFFTSTLQSKEKQNKALTLPKIKGKWTCFEECMPNNDSFRNSCVNIEIYERFNLNCYKNDPSTCSYGCIGVYRYMAFRHVYLCFYCSKVCFRLIYICHFETRD